MMALPPDDEVVSLDGSFWRFRLVEPYQRVVFLPWDTYHSHVLVGELTRILGAEFLTTILAVIPSLMSKAIPVSHAVSSVLIERGAALTLAFRQAANSGLLTQCMRDVWACAGDTPSSGQCVSLSEVFTPPGQRSKGAPPTRGLVRGPVDLYNVAIATALENLFPLAPGECERRNSIPPSLDPPTPSTQTMDPDPTDPPVVAEDPEQVARDKVEAATTRAMGLPEVRHIVTYMQIRGA